MIVFSLSYFLKNNDLLRYDATEGQVSSLSPTTTQLIRQLNPERPIVIDAYISVGYARAIRQDALRPGDAAQGIRGHCVQPTRQAASADQRQPRTVGRRSSAGQEAVWHRATRSFVSANAVRSRIKKSCWVPPFAADFPKSSFRSSKVVFPSNTNWCGRSTPSRSPSEPSWGSSTPMPISWVASRWPVAVSNRSPSSRSSKNWKSNTKSKRSTPALRSRPINIDVLFVVQPSSLNPQQLTNLVDAVKAGVPTAIFEDPMPAVYQGIPGDRRTQASPEQSHVRRRCPARAQGRHASAVESARLEYSHASRA